jgi:hypothetical protein
MQILKPKFDSHEASFDSQTRTSTRVSTARFTRETMQGAIEACRFERFHGKMRIEREMGLLF